ncbi:MAG: hypothetical protein IJY84_01560 [Clostridia bacterium]|nr:hypothetical protein [Clostridia bacterium]
MNVKSKFRILVTTCCAFIVSLCLAIVCGLNFSFETASADGTLGSNAYQTDGASVRVFEKKSDGTFSTENVRKGIRFHVEMGAGYSYDGTEVVDVNSTVERNGAYALNAGFKTYTLIIPTRLLTGDLTMETESVLAIDTSEYWYDDNDGNLESVAYVYNIPDANRTDALSYRGVICTVDGEGNKTVIAQTEIEERSLTFVAKQAYDDTLQGSIEWGDKSEEHQTHAETTLLSFIPQYTIKYDVNGFETTETVLWGESPQNVPTEGVKGAWYDTKNSEAVDVAKTMDYSDDRTLDLVTSTSTEFVLTGVAAETDFEVGGNTYHGVKIFATLPRNTFANKTQMDVHAVNVEHLRDDAVLCDGIELQGVWTLEEENSLGEWQMRLFFALDTSTLQSGDQIVIKNDSVFYSDGVMYKLTEDYVIDYTKENDEEDYGMFLGYLYNSDVSQITNCSEDSSGNQGEPDEFTIRVEFYEDVMINGEFTFEFGPDSDTLKYTYPVFIRCGEDKTKLIPIAGGRYYWNDGEHKILELIGAGDYVNKVFGWHKGDELIAAPGTIVKQNGGYYIFHDEMYGYFLTNDKEDEWGYALGDWVVGDELDEYTTSEFDEEGSVAETTDYGALADEIRINTVNHWFGQAKVSLLTTEKMLKDAPYAIYCTSKDGTVTEIDEVRYHGQANPDGGNYQILGLCGEGKFSVGDVVTIAEGTRFWLGTEYYTLSEEINYYYNGNYWVKNYDENTMGELSSENFGDRAHNQGATELRMYFTAPLAGYTTTDEGGLDELRIGTGSITFNGNPVSYVRYQRWDANSTWLSLGGYSGSVAFGDKVVIEAGTTIWGANKVAYKFTDKVEWIYSANPADEYKTWSRVRGGVTVTATAENSSVSGSGTFALGETYILNVAPNDGYLISSVIVNSNDLSLKASNVYEFIVARQNTIEVSAVVGHKVTFNCEGATVDGGAISNGEFKTVAHGSSLTFSASASEGYKLLGVDGATDNGDGTYTVANVTSEKTVTIRTEKLYKVTYSGNNASITANVASGTWVDNGTTVTFTVSVESGYILAEVKNATKVNATTYTATVNGADLNVVATALNSNDFVDITERIQIEDRTWGAHTNEVYVGVLDTGVTYTVTNQDGTTSTNHYFNTSVTDTWYVGNDAPITNNGGVDIMEYIYVNGVSARSLITANANGVRNSNACACWLSNPAAYPVCVETTNGSGLMMRLATAAFGTEFTITIKAGFRITDANGDLVAVTKDVNFKYNNATITKEVITSQYSVTFGNVTGASVTANGNPVADGAKLSEGTEITITPSEAYNVSSVTVDGEALTLNNGVYTFTLLKDSTINVSATIKTYTATVSVSNATVNGISNNQPITHGETYNFTASVNSGCQLTSVTINGVEQGTSGSYSFTASGATSIVVTAKKLYAVTWSNPTGATISVTANGNAISSGATVTEGTSISVTVTASSGYRLNTVTIGGAAQGSVNTAHNGSSTFNYTVNANTDISATTVKMYQVTWSNPTGATISVSANGSTISSGAVIDAGTSISVTATANSGYRLNTVTIGGASQSGVSTSQAGSSTFSYTVNANTSISATTVKMYKINWSVGDKTSITCNTSGVTNGGWVDNGATITFTIKSTDSSYKLSVSGASNTSGDTYSVTINGADVTVKSSATYDVSCLVEGTMVMMADGTVKAVDDVVAGDMVMVFNHETGKYEVGTIWFNDHANDPSRLRKVINLEFANGSKSRIAYEHGYFDLDLMKYVFIREDNMHEFIGHRFVTSTFNGTEVVQGETTLVKAYITEEVVKVYGPITEYHFNMVTDDMLSMPSFNFDATGMVNIFEYDEDLKYNAEKMQTDIETYGVFTYEEFSAYMSYEDYCKAPIAYFKVAIGKGNLTWEQIELTLNYLAENEF